MQKEQSLSTSISFDQFKARVIQDYKIAFMSRECSLVGRREVLTGKAKFGIFGDGKEIAQLAWARVFKKGDFRSGYYRDQTFMFAKDLYPIQDFFCSLYAQTDIKKEPFSAGRQMGGHFATHSLNDDGSWKNLSEQYNSSSDISCTAGQMPRLLGLAQASKVYRELKDLKNRKHFSNNGNEVAWGTIGNASTSEGLFFEAINAAGVLQIPMVISVWDDAYGISVHNKYHTTKESISEVLAGFQRTDTKQGLEIIEVKGWDYIGLIDAYEKAEKFAREEYIPVLVHVTEMTQPQGHSTSGSHERYKNEKRLQWEREFDCNKKFKQFILDNNISTSNELKAIEKEIKTHIREEKNKAWKQFISVIINEQLDALAVYKPVIAKSTQSVFIKSIVEDLENKNEPLRKYILESGRKILRYIAHENFPEKTALINWINNYQQKMQPKYSSFVYNESSTGVTHIEEVLPTYDTDAPIVDGRLVLRDNFDTIFANNPDVLIFGEDVGKIGDVNQGLEGLQDKYGETRVADTGIREPTIIGQGIGMAQRGLRPIAEIQYLDYILYCMSTLSDDLACLRYRTHNKQKAPLIIRTRGHRLEGIWHSGSPMSALIGLLRGIHILVPRNMTKAAGFYNTLLKSDEPGLIIENLNGYRLKEKLPNNLGKFCTPIGYAEVIKDGKDITLVSYGSTLKLVEEAARELLIVGINAEIIDIQSLLPFDLDHVIARSVAKTNRILIIDEDMPGGATGYILQQVMDVQKIFKYLDSAPQTLSAKPHRPAYGTDGDYFSKPSKDDIFEKVYDILNESNPNKFPKLR
mgnify:CR=1 FL=1